MDIGGNIKRLREAVGMSQEACARAVGVAWITWQKWEAGQIDLPTSRLPQIAAVLETTPEELVAA